MRTRINLVNSLFQALFCELPKPKAGRAHLYSVRCAYIKVMAEWASAKTPGVGVGTGRSSNSSTQAVSQILLHLPLIFELISVFTIIVWKNSKLWFFSWRTQISQIVECVKLDTSHPEWWPYWLREGRSGNWSNNGRWLFKVNNKECLCMVLKWSYFPMQQWHNTPGVKFNAPCYNSVRSALWENVVRKCMKVCNFRHSHCTIQSTTQKCHGG